MEKYKTDGILKKWFWCVVHFLCFIPISHAQFFTDSYIVSDLGTNVSIQDVLIDGPASYLYGTYSDEMVLDGISLSHIGEADAFLLKRVNGETEWIFFGGSAGNDLVVNLSFDTNQNIIISGSFTNEAQFDQLTLKSEGSSRAIFVIGLSSEGEILESHVVNGTGTKELAGVELIDDQIYLAGSFSDTLFVGNTEAISISDKDIFLMKLEDNIEPAWIQNYGIEGKNDAKDFSWSAAAEQFVISGQFDKRISVAQDSIQTNSFDEDLFLAAFQKNGVGKWLKKLGGVFEDFNKALALDEGGNIYLTGDYRGIIKFDDGSEINTGGIGNSDSYLIKCNSDGNKVWARTLGDEGQEFGTDLAIQGDKLNWSGYYNDAFTIDGILFSEPAGSLAGTFAVFDANTGLLEANLKIPSSSIVVPMGITNSSGVAILYGDFSGETSFDQSYDAGLNFAGFTAEINVQSVSTSTIANAPPTDVYPNPTKSIVHIAFDYDVKNIQVFNLDGILIYENFSPELVHKVDLSNQPDGLYFWRSSDGRSGKLVKK